MAAAIATNATNRNEENRVLAFRERTSPNLSNLVFFDLQTGIPSFGTNWCSRRTCAFFPLSVEDPLGQRSGRNKRQIAN